MYFVTIQANELTNKFITNPEFMLSTKKQLYFMMEICFKAGYGLRIVDVGEEE